MHYSCLFQYFFWSPTLVKFLMYLFVNFLEAIIMIGEIWPHQINTQNTVWKVKYPRCFVTGYVQPVIKQHLFEKNLYNQSSL